MNKFLLMLILNVSTVNSTECFNPNGQLVKVEYNNNFPSIAVAVEKSGTTPLTVINPTLMNKFSKQMGTFVQFHECGHHSLGHLINNSSTTMSQEQEADCYGIRVALTLGKIQFSDLEILQKEISSIGTGDWQHLSGATRSLNIKKCLGEGYQEKPWITCKEKFYSNLNSFKSATTSLNQMAAICKKFGKNSNQCLEAKSLAIQLHQGLTASTGLIDQQCPFVMVPNFSKVMADYGNAFNKLNNLK